MLAGMASISVYFGANSVHACLRWPASHLINPWCLRTWCHRRHRLEALSHGLAGMQMRRQIGPATFTSTCRSPVFTATAGRARDCLEILPLCLLRCGLILGFVFGTGDSEGLEGVVFG
ncbi:hypothetical protein CDAR_460141 [Caerostris darwini]|uniref:Uncharacterized protein n=1 Tax=Caerostris darwini TaxID=1538125 RepID=A0AAV4R8Y2_9ARAC|nr:hypothetical protein CDAR_460141 [Caerostris darwini]